LFVGEEEAFDDDDDDAFVSEIAASDWRPTSGEPGTTFAGSRVGTSDAR
jgi:hypothetical protein